MCEASESCSGGIYSGTEAAWLGCLLEPPGRLASVSVSLLTVLAGFQQWAVAKRAEEFPVSAAVRPKPQPLHWTALRSWHSQCV